MASLGITNAYLASAGIALAAFVLVLVSLR